MTTYMAWMKAHENDVRILLPAVQEQLNARRAYSEQRGKRIATERLARANERKTATERRARAVVVGLAAIKERMDTDPRYRAQQAVRDANTLRAEWERLSGDLIHIALAVEDAREIDRDPVSWSEQDMQRFPALADRLPSLPVFP